MIGWMREFKVTFNQVWPNRQSGTMVMRWTAPKTQRGGTQRGCPGEPKRISWEPQRMLKGSPKGVPKEPKLVSLGTTSCCTDFGTSGYRIWYFGLQTLVLRGTDFGPLGYRLWCFGVPTLVLRGNNFGTSGYRL